MVSGGALWRGFCQSIRGFEGRRIFEMGIRVRRRAEKSSSSSTAVAAAAAAVATVAGVEERKRENLGRKEGTNGRGIARGGERGVGRRVQRGSIQRWTKVHSHLPPGREKTPGRSEG